MPIYNFECNKCSNKVEFLVERNDIDEGTLLRADEIDGYDEAKCDLCGHDEWRKVVCETPCAKHGSWSQW